MIDEIQAAQAETYDRGRIPDNNTAGYSAAYDACGVC